MKKGANRSPLLYVGDKYKLISEIQTYFPSDIHRFIEPFVGGGSVFMNIKAESYLLNDIDSYVISLHKHLCKNSNNEFNFFNHLYNIIHEYGLSCSFLGETVPEKLKKQYIKTYYARYNKIAYTKLRTDFINEGQKDMFKLYLLLVYGFNHMLRFNRSGKFNLPVGNVDFNSNVHTALRNYFSKVRCSNIEWQNKDFIDFLNSNNICKDDFIYLDPPYLITFSEYNKFWNDKTEQSLLKLLSDLNRRGIKFAISNVTHYKGRENCDFINWSKHFNIHNIKSNYISFHDNTKKEFREVLVTNY